MGRYLMFALLLPAAVSFTTQLFESEDENCGVSYLTVRIWGWCVFGVCGVWFQGWGYPGAWLDSACLIGEGIVKNGHKLLSWFSFPALLLIVPMGRNCSARLFTVWQHAVAQRHTFAHTFCFPSFIEIIPKPSQVLIFHKPLYSCHSSVNTPSAKIPKHLFSFILHSLIHLFYKYFVYCIQGTRQMLVLFLFWSYFLMGKTEPKKIKYRMNH